MDEKKTFKTPTNSPTLDPAKTGTPDRLKVPAEPFKYLERYTSPTDQMMSPVTRRIIARSKKGIKLLPPSNAIANQPKIQGLRLQEPGMFESG
ncbi:hydroxyproline-rich glycoprotein family protein [Striga hermonthica]|uniref:Hydroxyproline-rich glycoprotein family protein n=1 Tax=Striga hermonthica TaxID=68872 RepID=A0A9N7ND70_STRHE|nr:hydroxyproline-rich glycoprotein family protein [Striga hermonthica]